MKILGIDPGTNRIGFGVIKTGGNNHSCVDFGVIENKGKDKISNLINTVKVLEKILDKHSPDKVGIEKLFFFSNQKTAIPVSETRGAMLFTIANKGLPILEFTPLQIKQSVSGYGRADKDQVHNMVKIVLGIKSDIRPDDAADALAIAICCANTTMLER